MKPWQACKTPMRLAEIVLAGRFLGYSVSSWGRTRVRNKAVGGSDTSQHQVWAAFDLPFDERDRAVNMEKAVEYFEQYDLWVQPLEQTKTYIHVQIKRKYLNAGDYIE